MRTHPPTCVTFTEGCCPAHAANWAKLSQEVLTVQFSSSRLVLLLLKLKARGAGKARPELTSCQLGSTALRSSKPSTSRCEPAKQCRPVASRQVQHYQKEQPPPRTPPYEPCISHTLCTWLHRSSTGSRGDVGDAVQVALRDRLSAGLLESELTEVQDGLSRTAVPSASEMA